MPTYEYRCKDCDEELEVVQSFTDDALTTCEACGGNLRKVFGSVGIAFKGSGFYKNDSRGKATSSAGANGNGDGGGDKAESGSSGASGNGSDTGAAKDPAGGKKDAKDAKKDSKKSAKAPAASSS